MLSLAVEYARAPSDRSESNSENKALSRDRVQQAGPCAEGQQQASESRLETGEPRKPYEMDALFTRGRPKFKVIDGFPWRPDGSVSNMSELPPPRRAIPSETAPLINATHLLEPARF